MDAKQIEWIIGVPLLLGLVVVSWWSMQDSEARLSDPNDNRTVYLNQLPALLALYGQGTYRVTIIRQSGNVHSEKIVTGTAQNALATAVATMRRAKIDAVHVEENSETQLRIGRLYHDHRGSAEGKKVGKAIVTLLERAPPIIRAPLADGSIRVQAINITCDCGHRMEVPFECVQEERSCAQCGGDATLTPEQVSSLHAAADSAREEAWTRYQAGENSVKVVREVGSGDQPPDHGSSATNAARD